LRTLWRISNHSDLMGLGGERSDGRWHSATRGKRIVYLAEHPALAVLEALAQLRGNPQLVPDGFQLLKIAVPGEVSLESVDMELPPDWYYKPGATRAAGDRWLAEKRSALLAVPSAVAPESTNYLLNPLHRNAAQVAIEWARGFRHDKRLFRLSAGGTA
jgi:RES domain-containing protein